MTLVSRDQFPPGTVYEADLRERLATMRAQCDVWQRLAMAQETVVAVARQIATNPVDSAALLTLMEALQRLDTIQGRLLIESMPAKIREAVTAPSVIEEVLNELPASFWDGAIAASPYGNEKRRDQQAREFAIVAHQETPAGSVKWDFDRAATSAEAAEKLRKWNERAAREWPDMHFTLREDT